jgi:hypothetical protein
VEGFSQHSLKGIDQRYRAQGEMWWSSVLGDARTKRVHAVMMARASPLVLIYEVTGLDQVKAFSGTCTLVPLATAP